MEIYRTYLESAICWSELSPKEDSGSVSIGGGKLPTSPFHGESTRRPRDQTRLRCLRGCLGGRNDPPNRGTVPNHEVVRSSSFYPRAEHYSLVLIERSSLTGLCEVPLVNVLRFSSSLAHYDLDGCASQSTVGTLGNSSLISVTLSHLHHKLIPGWSRPNGIIFERTNNPLKNSLEV